MSHLNEAVQTWRDELAVQKKALQEKFEVNKNANQLLKSHTRLVDSLLKKIWQTANIDKKISLIAAGGYGRGELFPHSDIDLLILLPDQVSDKTNHELESIIGTLWDIGLNVGHSVRSLKECSEEAAQDITVQTNLLESRLIVGDAKHFATFYSTIQQQLKPLAFLNAKVREQENRHTKLNDTGYSLEPNIKESPGGLRDIHTILWLARSQSLGCDLAQMLKNKVIGVTNYKSILRHQRNLNTLRIRLHYLAKRREDRLLFDYQNELAQNLGLTNNKKKRASEQLMQGYYRSVQQIALINEIMIETFRQNLIPNPVINPINERFVAKQNLMETKHPRVFEENPSAILECFLLLQQNPSLDGLGPDCLRQLQLSKNLVNSAFRQSVKNKHLFLQILSEKTGVNHSLRRMNRYGILGRYIPAFGKVIGQMQHDLFHVYTVDEHTLNVLENLRRFSKSELKHEFPLCSELFESFKRPHLLYIAALFHDIAKGRGGDHSVLGRVDAQRFCKSHGLPKADTDLVVWLVASHLQLSKTAQKSDLSDPAVIEVFASFVNNDYYLTALYLLTVADVRGTSPVVWNAWKARLFESLFIETRKVLKNNAFNVDLAIAQRKEEAQGTLQNYGLAPDAYERLWNDFGDAYFIRHNNDEIAWQTRLLIPHHTTKVPIIRAHLSPNGDGIHVMTYMLDNDELFARICNFFDRIAYTIGEATVFTTKHGYALNTFVILEQEVKSVSYSGLLKYIEESLLDKLNPKSIIEFPLEGRINRQVKHMPIATKVSLEKSVEPNYYLLDIIVCDRPGILACIAFVFLKHDIRLHNAKINTLGNRAEDTFLISDSALKPLTNARIKLLKAALVEL